VVHENLIKSKLEAMNCPADVFCSLTSVSPTRWSRALRGLAPLTGPEIESLSKVAEDLAGLVRDAEPFPLSFRNLATIKSLLNQRRNGVRWIPVPLGPEKIIREVELEMETARQ
jgi:hypothetical protein